MGTYDGAIRVGLGVGQAWVQIGAGGAVRKIQGTPEDQSSVADTTRVREIPSGQDSDKDKGKGRETVMDDCRGGIR